MNRRLAFWSAVVVCCGAGAITGCLHLLRGSDNLPKDVALFGVDMAVLGFVFGGWLKERVLLEAWMDGESLEGRRQ